jgi:hypothetical protein
MYRSRHHGRRRIWVRLAMLSALVVGWLVGWLVGCSSFRYHLSIGDYVGWVDGSEWLSYQMIGCLQEWHTL